MRGKGSSPLLSGSGQLDKEASQTRDYCVAKNATLRAARPDPSLRKERLFRMTIRYDMALRPRKTHSKFQRKASSFRDEATRCRHSGSSFRRTIPGVAMTAVR